MVFVKFLHFSKFLKYLNFTFKKRKPELWNLGTEEDGFRRLLQGIFLNKPVILTIHFLTKIIPINLY